MFTLCFTLSDSFATRILNRPCTSYLVRVSAFLILFQAIFCHGSAYTLAPILLSIYTLQFLYIGIGSIVLGYFLSGVGETKTIFKANLINLSIFVSLAPMLTWLYGILGTITTSLTSSLLSLIYQLTVAKKKLHVDFGVQESIKIYLASLISACPIILFLYLSPFQNIANVFLGGFTFLLTYLTIMPLLGAISKQDLENLELVFGRLKIVQPSSNRS